MAAASLSKLFRYLEPAWLAALTTLPAYRRNLVAITFLSGVAVFLELAALALIYILIVSLTGHDAEAHIRLPVPMPIARSPSALALACVVLLTAGISLKYVVIRQSTSASYRAGALAGRLALQASRPLLQAHQGQSWSSKELRGLIGLFVKDIPFACGFVAGRASLLVVHSVQIVLVLSVLLYLSPFLTLGLTSVAALAIAALSLPYESVVETASARKASAPALREEQEFLADSLVHSSADEAEFEKQVLNKMQSGRASHLLELRLAQRMTHQTGPLIMEYVYPIAVLCIVLIYLFWGDYAPHVSVVALYFLLFRQFVMSLNVAASTLMSFSRHHQSLCAFHALIKHGKLDPRRAGSGDTEALS